MKYRLSILTAFIAAAVLAGIDASAGTSVKPAPQRPNIVIILADDLGWSDVGFNGCREIPTPNLDALAADGVVFTSGYASHPYCSPSRAGLLTGRYQQRFGHECNLGSKGEDLVSGLPLSETFISDVLKEHGYRTSAIGKWHLGDAPKFWPIERGFDEWFGFSGGGMSYWGTTGKKPAITGVLRNGEIVARSELTYLTDDFTTEAVGFVERNQDKPFFMYLAYNAPHAPDQATREHLKKTEHIEYGGRAVYGAMVAAMDEGIGKVIARLKELGLYDNTLIFFYSDNGGRKEHATNYPFRGHKGMLFEGGIRVPFCISWPNTIKGGQRYDNPITALDIFPTALAAAGIGKPAAPRLDGVDLLPYIKGAKPGEPHHTLFWRYACGDDHYGYAVRDGHYKLVYSVFKGKTLLFDIGSDPWERSDIAANHPETVKRLAALYEEWKAGTVEPKWIDKHGENVPGEEAVRQAAIDAASRGDKTK